MLKDQITERLQSTPNRTLTFGQMRSDLATDLETLALVLTELVEAERLFHQEGCYSLAPFPARGPKQDREQRILEHLHFYPNQSMKQIQLALLIKDSALKIALRELTSEGKLQRHRQGSGPYRYSLK